MHASPHIWIPQYREPTRPTGLIPPSPPAEQRTKRERAIRKELTTWRRQYAPTQGGVLVPMEASRIGNPMSGGALSGLQGLGMDLYGANVSLPPAPLVYLRCEEAAGVGMQDSTGTLTDLTDHNTVGSGTGIIGNGRTFVNTSSQWQSHASNSTLQMGSGVSFTLSNWVFPNSLNQQPVLVGKTGGTNYEYYVEISTSSNNHVAFDIWNNAGTNFEVVSPAASIVTGSWQLIVAWLDLSAASGSRLNIQINNGTVVSSGTATECRSDTGTFSIGSDHGTGFYLNGSLDEIGVWKSVLTSAQRSALYNSGVGRSYYSGAWH